MDGITEYGSLFPDKITYISGKWKNSDILLKKRPLQIGTYEPDIAETESGSIVFDFGKEVSARLRILTFFAENGATVRIRAGESLSEAMSEIGEKGSCNDHSPRDIEAKIVSMSDLEFLNSGFRFIRLDFRGKASIKSVVASYKIFSCAPNYTYDGNDSEVAAVFDVAKRTIDLCLSGEYIWDGIKRDRLVWMGDIYPEIIAAVTLYGRQSIIEKTIDYMCESYPVPLWMNGMVAYSLWWIIIIADYYKMTGCGDFVLKNKKYLLGVINMVNDCIADDGEMNYPSYFVDWPTHDKVDEKPGVRALSIIACKKAENLFNFLNLNTDILKHLIEKLQKKDITVVTSKQVVALKYSALGRIDEREKSILISGGAKSMSTFMSYFILKAVADNCGTDIAILMMKEYYGGMLRMGATSFWEDFNVDWMTNACPVDRLPNNNETDIHGDFGEYCYKGFRHSLCHGWSAGVIRFIFEYLK